MAFFLKRIVCFRSARFAYASADVIIYFLLCTVHLFICSHFFMRLGLTTANRRWAMDMLFFTLIA